MNHIDVRQATCLDVGAAHGLVSFGLKTKGAHRVVAVDRQSAGTQFNIARELLGLDVEHVGFPVKHLSEHFNAQSIDLVVATGLMYHLANPGDAIWQTRKVLKPGGLLVLETYFDSEREDAALLCNNVPNPPLDEPYTYFVPTRAAVEQMLRLACFDVIATQINSPGKRRLTVLARAVTPTQVADRPDITRRAHELIQDSDLPFKEYRQQLEWTADIQYDGQAAPFAYFDVNEYTPDFPPHPRQLTNPLGTGVLD